MSGREGRTVWAEVKRTVTLEPVAQEVVLVPVEPPADYRAPRDRSRVDERVARTGGWRPVPAGVRR